MSPQHCLRRRTKKRKILLDNAPDPLVTEDRIIVNENAPETRNGGPGDLSMPVLYIPILRDPWLGFGAGGRTRQGADRGRGGTSSCRGAHRPARVVCGRHFYGVGKHPCESASSYRTAAGLEADSPTGNRSAAGDKPGVGGSRSGHDDRDACFRALGDPGAPRCNRPSPPPARPPRNGARWITVLRGRLGGQAHLRAGFLLISGVGSNTLSLRGRVLPSRADVAQR